MKPIDDSLQSLLFSSHSQYIPSLVKYSLICISLSMCPLFHNVKPPPRNLYSRQMGVILLTLLRFKFTKSSGFQNVVLRGAALKSHGVLVSLDHYNKIPQA